MIARIAYGVSGVGAAYLISGLALLWWAFCLMALSPDMLDRSNAYHALAEVADGRVWGGFCFALGLVQVAAFARAVPIVMAIVGGLAAAWWAVLAAGFWAAPVPTTGAGMYTILSAASVWGAIIMWRAR